MTTVRTQASAPRTQINQRAPHEHTLSTAGLFTILLGASLPVIDFFIVNVALPTIDQSLNASAAKLEMVIAGYGIAYSLLLVLGGRLGDTFGRRKLFFIGLTAFTLTSLVCGIAPTIDTLILGRIGQGAAAAMMMPQVLSTIQAATRGEHRSKALGFYGATGGICTVVGQLLGGVLVAANIGGTSWRPIFLVNVPIGIAALLLARKLVPETRATNPPSVDWIGTVLFGVAMLTLLVPLMEGRALGWPWWTWALLMAFPFAVVAFVFVERRAERSGGVPLLPPSLMRLPSMRRGLSLGVPFFVGFGGFMFVYALTLQDGLHFGPLESGLALTPLAVSFFAASWFSSRFVARFGQKVVTIGAVLQACGLGALIVADLIAWPNLSILALAPGMLLAGFGQGLVITTLFRVVLSQVPSERAGVGSGALTTTQQTSLAMGVATLGTLFLALSSPELLGMRYAFVVVLGIQILAAVGIIAFSGRLPDPRER